MPAWFAQLDTDHNGQLSPAEFAQFHAQPVPPNAAPMLQKFDADFDFGGNKLNLISQNHCEGKVVYWPATTTAVVPFAHDAAGHLTFPMTLDGRRVRAMLERKSDIICRRCLRRVCKA